MWHQLPDVISVQRVVSFGLWGHAPMVAKRYGICPFTDKHGCWVRPCVEGEALFCMREPETVAQPSLCVFVLRYFHERSSIPHRFRVRYSGSC